MVVATGSLDILQKLYRKIHVPYEVRDEILQSSIKQFAIKQYEEADFLLNCPAPQNINPFLRNLLDKGEAAVIQFALDNGIEMVCIDEKVGSCVAKLNNLQLTGSIGILIKARNLNYITSMHDAVKKMKDKGIFLSENVVSFALKKTGEV